MATLVRFELTMMESESTALPLGYRVIYFFTSNKKLNIIKKLLIHLLPINIKEG